MTDNITITGVVGTDPHHHVTTQGLPITSFRLASTRRYFDRAKASWEDGETNWYTVSAFRQLASNTSQSIRKGERVVVFGRLRLRAWETGEKSGTAVEIEADAIGHDLSWGIASYTKVRSARAADAPTGAEPDGSHDAGADPDPGAASGWPGDESVARAGSTADQPAEGEFEAKRVTV